MILIAAAGRSVDSDVNTAPFRAGDLDLPDDERLAALTLAFFAPRHDARRWLTGWYPKTPPDAARERRRDRSGPLPGAGSAPIFELSAERDPFHQRREWDDLRSEYEDRVTATIIGGASHAMFPEQPAAIARAAIGYPSSERRFI